MAKKTSTKAKTLTPAVLNTSIHYTSEDVIECISANDTLNSSFQTVLNSLYAENRLDEVLKACNTLRKDFGQGKALNRKLDIIRTQVVRTCQVHDVPSVGIKWDKDKNSFIFVSKPPKTNKPKDEFMQAVATFRAKGATDAQKKMVMRLMISLLEGEK